jgi:hypothetical protein
MMGLWLVCLLIAAGGVSATCDTHKGTSAKTCRACLAADSGVTGCACEYNQASGTCQSTMGILGCDESGSDGFTQDDNSCPECVEGFEDCSDSPSGAFCVDNSCRECVEDADCSVSSYGPGATCVDNSCLRADPEHTAIDTGTNTSTGTNSHATCDNDMWHVMSFLALAFALANFVIWCAEDFWGPLLVVCPHLLAHSKGTTAALLTTVALE